MVMDDCLRRSIFRKAKLVCHNRLRWEQIIIKKKHFSPFPSPLSWLYIKRLTIFILQKGHRKCRLYVILKTEGGTIL